MSTAAVGSPCLIPRRKGVARRRLSVLGALFLISAPTRTEIVIIRLDGVLS